MSQRKKPSGAFAVAEGSSICPQIVQLMEYFCRRGGDVVLTRSLAGLAQTDLFLDVTQTKQI